MKVYLRYQTFRNALPVSRLDNSLLAPVIPCYSLLSLLPIVSFVTPFYHCSPLVLPCFFLLPLLLLVTLVSPCYPYYPLLAFVSFYPLLPLFNLVIPLTPFYLMLPLFTPVTRSYLCSPLLLSCALGTLFHPFFPLVIPVTFCYEGVTSGNRCYSLLLLLPLCYPLYPLLPLVPLLTVVTLVTSRYSSLPLLFLVTFCYPCYPWLPLLPLVPLFSPG